MFALGTKSTTARLLYLMNINGNYNHVCQVVEYVPVPKCWGTVGLISQPLACVLQNRFKKSQYFEPKANLPKYHS